MTCPDCGADMVPVTLRPGFPAMSCVRIECSRIDPMPAAYEVEVAGGQMLPGMETP